MAYRLRHTVNDISAKPYTVRHSPAAVIHTPVMLEEVIKYLAPEPGKKYIDATLGYGGHAIALLEKGAEVLGIDRDEAIIELAGKRIADAGFSSRFSSVRSSFADALDPSRSLLEGQYDGVLFDLGVSSLQLDTPDRGFSFRYDAPLDMRMDRTLAVTAADLVNGLGRKELAELFDILGEERFAKQIAGAIADRRKVKLIQTTLELAGLIEAVVPRTGRIHPATKVFQALRMAVNTEREELKAALPSALSRLSVGGVMVVISFHSLEDKIIKDYMISAEAEGSFAVNPASPIDPSATEVAANPRARSAKLRIGRKIQ